MYQKSVFSASTSTEHNSSALQRSEGIDSKGRDPQISRRALGKAGLWGVPAIMVATALPAAAGTGARPALVLVNQVSLADYNGLGSVASLGGFEGGPGAPRNEFRYRFRVANEGPVGTELNGTIQIQFNAPSGFNNWRVKDAAASDLVTGNRQNWELRHDGISNDGYGNTLRFTMTLPNVVIPANGWIQASFSCEIPWEWTNSMPNGCPVPNAHWMWRSAITALFIPSASAVDAEPNVAVQNTGLTNAQGLWYFDGGRARDYGDADGDFNCN